MSEQLCPLCNLPLSADTQVDGDAQPCAGDCSVCFWCAGPLIFNHDLTRRQMSTEEIAELHPTTRMLLERTRKLIRELRGITLQ